MSNVKKAFDISGFNPHKKNSFGDGYICAMLVIFDTPFMVLAAITNLLIGKSFKIKSMGLAAFKDVWRNKSLASIIGFVFLIGAGIGCWASLLGLTEYRMNYLIYVMFIVYGIGLAVINIAATIKYNFMSPVNGKT